MNTTSNLRPEGVYKVKATSWGWNETGTGNAQFQMTFEILGVANRDNLKADPKPCEPGTGSWSVTLASEENLAWLISNVQSLGYDRDDLRGLDPDEAGAFNFEGKEFFASCRPDEYKGVTREKWSLFKPRKLAKDRLLALNERFAPTVKSMQANAPAKTVAPTESPKVDAAKLPY